MVMTEDEKKMTAYHEGGHALVMMHAKGHEPLHKVTIIPRGRALGVTMWLPERDKYAHSEVELRARIASSFGGRVAEEMIYGKENVTTGAAQDIQQATQIARAMVTQYGFSDILGPLRYSENEEEVFLGHSVTQRKNVSEATQQLIDEETRRVVSEGEKVARDILQEHIESLHTIAKGLLEYETLSREEIEALLRGENISRGGDEDATPPSDAPASVPSSGKMGGPIGGFDPEPQPGS
jgi:cell division protease FtsH